MYSNNYARLRAKELPELLGQIDQYDGRALTRLALHMSNNTILHEHDFNHEHIERQLAHAPRNVVSAAYNHARYLEQRAQLMQHWSDDLDEIKAGAKVIKFKSA